MSDVALEAGDIVVRIHSAQYDAARSAYFTAEQGLSRVNEAEERTRKARNAAAQDWQAQLKARAFDPGMVRLAGDWLLERERDLDAACLDTQIAEGQRDAAQSALQQAQARLDASVEARAQRVREWARRREEKDLTAAADRFLQRWSR